MYVIPRTVLHFSTTSICTESLVEKFLFFLTGTVNHFTNLPYEIAKMSHCQLNRIYPVQRGFRVDGYRTRWDGE